VICLLYILLRIPTWVRAMVFRSGRGSPLGRLARTVATVAIFRGVLGRAGAGRGGAGRAAAGAAGRMPPPPRPLPEPSATRPLPAGQQFQRWEQPELPLSWPSPRGTQLELFTAPPSARRPRYTQMPLPAGGKPAAPPRWEQPVLPVRTRYEQLKLPVATPRHTQPALPLNFPERGTPQAGTPRPANPAAQRHLAQLWDKQRRRELHERLVAERDRLVREQQAQAARNARRRRRGGGGSA
jgi:hypothetical protein